jgi:hypothetical protein
MPKDLQGGTKVAHDRYRWPGTRLVEVYRKGRGKERWHVAVAGVTRLHFDTFSAAARNADLISRGRQ